MQLFTGAVRFGEKAVTVADQFVYAGGAIPMAISLGFGVLFVTLIVLLIVPTGYHIVEDARQLLGASKQKAVG